jgi:hypothetical protein
LTISAKDRTGKVGLLTLTGVTEPGPARQMVLLLTTVAIKDWRLAGEKSEKKVIVQAYNGNTPVSVEVLLKGLDSSYTPRVNRLSK